MYRATPLIRSFSTAVKAAHKVTVLGGAGGIGQPLSLLLKQNPKVTKLAVYDIAAAKGVACDLSHINTPAQVTGYVGDAELEAAVKDAKIVVIPAGVPRKPGMTRDDLFNTNASIVKNLVDKIAKVAPNAFIAIITNPVNSTIAIAGEVLKKNGVKDWEKRLFGVTTLDVTRARTFVAEATGKDVQTIDVPVIGGHAGATILPLLSQTTPAVTLNDELRNKLTVRIQNGGTEVVDAKAGAGSATLSMAHAGAEFVDALLSGLNGKAVRVCTMVASNVVPELKYFANKVELGKQGVQNNLGLGKLSAYEQEKLQKEVVPELKSSIAKGEKFAQQ